MVSQGDYDENSTARKNASSPINNDGMDISLPNYDEIQWQTAGHDSLYSLVCLFTKYAHWLEPQRPLSYSEKELQ